MNLRAQSDDLQLRQGSSLRLAGMTAGAARVLQTSAAPAFSSNSAAGLPFPPPPMGLKGPVPERPTFPPVSVLLRREIQNAGSMPMAPGARRAIAHLRSIGFLVSIVDRDAAVPSWRVSGFAASLSNEQLVELATKHGSEECKR